MSYDTWYEINEYTLKEKFVAENADLGILDDEYADLHLRFEFQQYCETEYNKRQGVSWMKIIGIKDTYGNNVALVSHNKRMNNDFWNIWSFESCTFCAGDGMAKMIVKKR